MFRSHWCEIIQMPVPYALSLALCALSLASVQYLLTKRYSVTQKYNWLVLGNTYFSFNTVVIRWPHFLCICVCIWIVLKSVSDSWIFLSGFWILIALCRRAVATHPSGTPNHMYLLSFLRTLDVNQALYKYVHPSPTEPSLLLVEVIELRLGIQVSEWRCQRYRTLCSKL